MTRNLVVCLDGTWNKADAPFPTNVVMTHRAAATAAGIDRQLVYYDPGVGTKWYERVRGGVAGLGLALNVEEAYSWLCQHHRPGDRVFLFGYSRGAYTARSLAGLIGLCGIPTTEVLVRDAVAAYRRRPGRGREAAAESLRIRERLRGEQPAGVHFLGVWDTVGSLGVPHLTDWRHRWHDVRIGEHISIAVHLLAIDEQRRPFAPALWTGDQAPGQSVEQVWFPGVHGDVGGGRSDIGLSNRSLNFMWSRARLAGLELDPGYQPVEPPIERCSIGDSMTGLYRVLGSYRRPIGTGVTGEAVHQSAVELVQASPQYRKSESGRALLEARRGGTQVAA